MTLIRIIKRIVPEWIKRWGRTAVLTASCIARLRFRPALLLLSRNAIRLFPLRVSDGRHIRRVSVRGLRFPFFLREGTSDIDVFMQVFGRQEYICLKAIADTRLIIDCGANIGLTSVYLLNAYPNATLLAVEPDPHNAHICRLNLAPYGDRARVVEAAIWNTPCGMRVVRGEYGDGRDWAVQVREVEAGAAADVRGVTVTELLAQSGASAIDILKIDIEGAETNLFSSGCEDWLSRTRNLAIELHDNRCEQAFRRSLAGYAFAESQSGELTVCRDMRERDDPSSPAVPSATHGASHLCASGRSVSPWLLGQAGSALPEQ